MLRDIRCWLAAQIFSAIVPDDVREYVAKAIAEKIRRDASIEAE